MKKPLLSFLLFVCFAAFGETALAITAPILNYNTTNSYSVGTPLTTPLSPTNTGGAVGTGTTFGTGVVLTGATISGPRNLGIDPSGNIYVANASNGTISVWDKNGVFIRNVSGFTAPVGIVFDSSGNAYILDNSTKLLYKITGNTAGNLNGTTATISTTALKNPYGLAIDGSGNIYVSDYNASTYGLIYKYTGSGTTYTRSTLIPNTYLYYATDVALDATGSIYVTNPGYPNVTKFTSTGGYSSVFTTGVTSPYSIYFDSNGNAYVADATANLVRVFSSTGAAITTISVTNPEGVVVDSKGDVFVSSFSGNKVYEFPPVSGYYLTGTLPAGLSFDSTTGNISGTPTAVTASTLSYTVTAYNTGGGGTSNTFTITVYPAKPTISYSGSPYSFNTGSAITAQTPVTSGSPTNFTISPSLPTNTGLSFSSTTGVISGTPTIVTTATTYTISAYNTNPTPGTVMISIATPAPAVPTVVYSTNNYTYTQSTTTAITNITPTTANSPTSFAITPTTLTANTGLSFNTGTGVISGYPSTVSAAVTYSVTATNSAGTSAATPITITVTLPKPAFTYSTPQTYTAGIAITTLKPTNSSGGGAVASYSISPLLPNGLSIDPTTGYITGTPTAYTATATYTVTGTNATGSSTFVITITVNQKPVFTYSPNSYTLTVGTALPSTVTPVSTGGAVPTTGFGTGTALSAPGNYPQGLAFDASGNLYVADNTSTGRVKKYTAATGTPVAVGPTFSYPVGLVFDALGNSYVLAEGTSTVIKVNSSGTAVTFNGPTFNSPDGIAIDANNNIYVADYDAGSSFTGTITGLTSTGAVFMTISTNINGPTGVAVDAAGNIYALNEGSDNVTKYDKNGNYISTIITGLGDPYAITIDASGNIYVGDSGNDVVNMYNSSGTLLYTFSSNVVDPEGIAVDVNGNVYISDYFNYTIYKNPPVGGYYLSGTLPPGLLFNTNTGQFTGTPTVGFPSTTYTVTAYNATGSNTTTITFACPTTTPNITYTPATNVYNVGTAITILTPANTGGAAASYSINTALPAGLLFNPNTGTISGTPTAVTATTVYTITATNTAGSYATTETITVNPALPVITYSTPVSYGVGATVSLSPTSTGGAVASYAAPSLPAGLTINTTTGVISGMPTTAAAATNYTVTATNAGGTGSFIISITIVAEPAISYTPSTVSYPVNAVITPLSPTNSGGKLYPAGYGTGTTFATVTAPWGMAVDASGDIFVLGYTGKTLTEYFTSGTTTTLTLTNKATGVVVDASGNIYVLLANGRIYKYPSITGTGVILTSYIYNYDFNSTTSTGSGEGIAIDASNNLYITDYNDGAIFKYTASTGTTAVLVAYGATGIYYPTGVAVDAAGNVYIVDANTKALTKYNSSGAYVSTVLSGFNSPYSLFIDAAGNFYIGGSTAAGAVSEYNSNGTLIQTVTTSLASPRGIVVDPSGNLYVSDYNNGTVTKYLPYYYTISPSITSSPGLSFNATTGIFTGTPTSASGPITYTVTAYGFGHVPVTTTEIITCYTSYDWVGTQTGGYWSTAANWASGIVPGSTNTANIGVNVAFTNAPVVSASTSVGAVLMGNKGGQAASVYAANGVTLTVNGDITKQSDANSATGYTATILGSGTGTISAVNANVLANTSTATGTYTEGMGVASGNLVLSGNINLTSTNSSYAANAAFTVSGGVASLTGTGTSNGIISTSNVTGSTSTLAMTGGTLQFANATPLSGLSATGTNTLSLTGGVIDYHGAAQTVYTDAAITGLSTGVSYYGITFSGSGVKTLNGGTTNNLNVAGNFTNLLANTSASYVLLNSTIVNFNGTAAQALAGGTTSINYGSIFNTVNFSNAGTKTMSGSFYVASKGTLNMSNGAQLVAGDNVTSSQTTADAYLTLLSDVNGAATVPLIPSGCAITGNVNVQRYITGGTATYRGYRMLSSPVSTSATSGILSMNYLINQVYLTATSGTSGGFDGGSNPSLYLFRENLLPNNSTFTGGNFRGVNNVTAAPSYTIDVDGAGYSVPTGNGYQMFYRGDRKAAAYATETTTSYVPTADTLTATGYLNQGSITVKDWYTPSSTNLGYTTISGSTNIEGYNLLGNPYASSINFDTYSTTNSSAGLYAPGVNPFVYILDPVSKNYNVYQAGNSGAGTIAHTGSNVIASGQGFFVVANTASAQFIFNEAAKITSQANAANGNLFLALQQNPVSEKSYLRLELNKDTINRDAIFINFNTGANANYAANEDAPYKVGHGEVSLASRSVDGISLAINSTPYPKQSQPIPLNVSTYVSGSYTLKMTDRKNMPDMYDIWLKDAYMKDSLDIKHNTTYTFDVNTADTNSYGNNRFSLIIRQDPALSLHLLSFTAKKVTSTVLTNWTVENEANYTKFNLLKSADGIAFSSIDSLLSNGTGAYAFTDSKPQANNYYKLQLTDLAGNITFSSVVQVGYANTAKATNNLTVYPNPTNSMINIAVNQGTIATSGLQNQTVATSVPATGQSYDIKITNMTGEVLKTVTAVSATWQNNVSSLLPGTYIIQVFNHGSSSVVGRTTFVKL